MSEEALPRPEIILCQTSVPNESMHIRNVFAMGEMQADSVVKDFLTTAANG